MSNMDQQMHNFTKAAVYSAMGKNTVPCLSHV